MQSSRPRRGSRPRRMFATQTRTGHGNELQNILGIRNAHLGLLCGARRGRSGRGARARLLQPEINGLGKSRQWPRTKAARPALRTAEGLTSALAAAVAGSLSIMTRLYIMCVEDSKVASSIRRKPSPRASQSRAPLSLDAMTRGLQAFIQHTKFTVAEMLAQALDAVSYKRGALSYSGRRKREALVGVHAGRSSNRGKTNLSWAKELIESVRSDGRAGQHGKHSTRGSSRCRHR